MCSCQVPHFVEKGVGWPDFVEKTLARFVAGSSFCRGLGPQKPDLALQNGDTQPPPGHFLGVFFLDLQSTVPNGDEVRDTMLKQSEDCRAW